MKQGRTHWIYSSRCAEFINKQKSNFLTWAELGPRKRVELEPTRDFHPCPFPSSRESYPPASTLSNSVEYSVRQSVYCPPVFVLLLVKVVVSLARA